MRSIHPITAQTSLPKKIEQIKHWLDLLGIEYIILKDNQDNTFNILLPIKDCPDIHIALESNFTHISFFSNGLTSLAKESQDAVQSFLKQILRLQSKYFTSRVILTGSSDDLRIFLGYRKIRELIQFVKEIAKLIEEHKMNELWRETEQEPKFPAIDISERVRFL